MFKAAASVIGLGSSLIGKGLGASRAVVREEAEASINPQPRKKKSIFGKQLSVDDPLLDRLDRHHGGDGGGGGGGATSPAF
jgi:hypothetical protein